MLRHAVRNSPEELRQMKGGVRIVTHSEQEKTQMLGCAQRDGCGHFRKQHWQIKPRTSSQLM